MNDPMAQASTAERHCELGPRPISGRRSADRGSVEAAADVDTSVWGDGFHEDSIWQLVGVRDWSLCSTDELARLLPGLHLPETGVSREIIDRLVRVVSRRSAQFESRRTSGRRSAGPLSETTSDDGALAALSSHLASFGRNLSAPFDPVMATTFAFQAGLHPGYVWHEARVTHGRETTACWLGLIIRGRSAFLVPEVSDFLAENLAIRNGCTVLTDPVIAGLAADYVDFGTLLRAVEDHRRGRRPIVRPTRGAGRMRAAMQAGRAALTSVIFQGVTAVLSLDVTGRR